MILSLTAACASTKHGSRHTRSGKCGTDFFFPADWLLDGVKPAQEVNHLAEGIDHLHLDFRKNCDGRVSGNTRYLTQK